MSADIVRILHRETSPLLTFQHNWHCFASFLAPKAADVPSIMFEVGDVSTEENARYLRRGAG